MTTNIGTIDRIFRVLVGLALVAMALGFFGPDYETLWGWVGVIPLATGLVGSCPIYTMLGLKTCKDAAAVSSK